MAFSFFFFFNLVVPWFIRGFNLIFIWLLPESFGLRKKKKRLDDPLIDWGRKIDMHLPRQVPCTWGREPADISWPYCLMQLELSRHPGPQGIRSWLGGTSREFLWLIESVYNISFSHVFAFIKTTGIVRDFEQFGVSFFFTSRKNKRKARCPVAHKKNRRGRLTNFKLNIWGLSSTEVPTVFLIVEVHQQLSRQKF